MDLIAEVGFAEATWILVVKSILIMFVLGGAFTLNDGPIGELLRMPGVGAVIRETPGATMAP